VLVVVPPGISVMQAVPQWPIVSGDVTIRMEILQASVISRRAADAPYRRNVTAR